MCIIILAIFSPTLSIYNNANILTEFDISIDGGDYVGKVENITFLAGETQKTVEVMIINDSVYEGLQEFSARLTTTDGGVNIFEPIANVRITDNDGRVPIKHNPFYCVN